MEFLINFRNLNKLSGEKFKSIELGLYRSKDLSNINFQTYLKNLIAQLSISYGIDENGIKINPQVLNITIDTAIPLDLLITEILTNPLNTHFQTEKEILIYDYWIR